MTDNFEKWINNMEEEEFIDRLESEHDNGGFSDAQEEKALNIRQPVEETELDQLEREQESTVQEVPSKPIYDTRQLPKKRRFFEVIRDTLVPVRTEKVKGVSVDITPRQEAPQQARPIPRPTIRERLASFFSFMRRRRPTPPTGEA